MSKLTKVVNIYPSMPITGVNPPIRSTVKRVTKSIDEIRTCLLSRATVEEILSDGKIVRLDISNYDKCLCDNKNEHVCGCGCCTCHTTTETEKTPWQIAYENALAGKNLAIMSRKQRRSAEAAARAAADAAVEKNEPEEEVVEAPVEVEPTEEPKEEVMVEPQVEVEEETVDTHEEIVNTTDVEDATTTSAE